MKTLLEAFANDNMSADAVNSGSYQKALLDMIETEKQFCEKLNESEKKLFTSFSDKQTELNIIENTDRFIHGFCLGALMMIEVFGEKNRILKN